MKKLILLLMLALLALPMSALAEEAVPTLEIGTLEPVELPGETDGLTAALYCGPTQGFFRHDELTLDLSKPFVYFGQFDCWAMVAQGTLDDMGPVGWIEAGAFLAPAEPQLGFTDALSVMVEDDTYLTDDPLSESPVQLCELARGTHVTLLAQYASWGYVQTEIDGVPVRAFLPQSSIL